RPPLPRARTPAHGAGGPDGQREPAAGAVELLRPARDGDCRRLREEGGCRGDGRGRGLPGGEGGIGAVRPPRAGVGEGATWDRTASIRVSGRTVCRASSVITIHSPECAVLIEEGSVGLGQLFRHLDRLPTFRLLDAGRSDADGGGDGAGGEERDRGFGGGCGGRTS
ncbi:hypothetical protein THAOC_26511, partial [Thalassiosira oceanica]